MSLHLQIEHARMVHELDVQKWAQAPDSPMLTEAMHKSALALAARLKQRDQGSMLVRRKK